MWSGGILTWAIFIVFFVKTQGSGYCSWNRRQTMKKNSLSFAFPLRWMRMKLTRLTRHRRGMSTLETNWKVFKSFLYKNAFHINFASSVLAIVQFLKSLRQYEVQTTWYAYSKSWNIMEKNVSVGVHGFGSFTTICTNSSLTLEERRSFPMKFN